MAAPVYDSGFLQPPFSKARPQSERFVTEPVSAKRMLLSRNDFSPVRPKNCCASGLVVLETPVEAESLLPP
jgi:hypothetical protein